MSCLLYGGDDSITRRHSKKVHKQYTRLDSRKYFYSQRVITPWNKLSQKTVIAESVNALKNNLDASYGTNWRSHKSVAIPTDREFISPSRYAISMVARASSSLGVTCFGDPLVKLEYPTSLSNTN